MSAVPAISYVVDISIGDKASITTRNSNDEKSSGDLQVIIMDGKYGYFVAKISGDVILLDGIDIHNVFTISILSLSGGSTNLVAFYNNLIVASIEYEDNDFIMYLRHRSWPILNMATTVNATMSEPTEEREFISNMLKDKFSFNVELQNPPDDSSISTSESPAEITNFSARGKRLISIIDEFAMRNFQDWYINVGEDVGRTIYFGDAAVCKDGKVDKFQAASSGYDQFYVNMTSGEHAETFKYEPYFPIFHQVMLLKVAGIYGSFQPNPDLIMDINGDHNVLQLVTTEFYAGSIVTWLTISSRYVPPVEYFRIITPANDRLSTERLFEVLVSMNNISSSPIITASICNGGDNKVDAVGDSSKYYTPPFYSRKDEMVQFKDLMKTSPFARSDCGMLFPDPPALEDGVDNEAVIAKPNGEDRQMTVVGEVISEDCIDNSGKAPEDFIIYFKDGPFLQYQQETQQWTMHGKAVIIGSQNGTYSKLARANHKHYLNYIPGIPIPVREGTVMETVECYDNTTYTEAS